jgi:hypothetical protein
VIHVLIIGDFDGEREDSVGPGGSMVEVMGGHNFVLDSLMVKLDSVLCIVASEHKEVLDCELVSFGPADFEAFVLGFVIL